MNHPAFKRRELLQAAAGATAIVTLPNLFPHANFHSMPNAFAQGNFDWKRYAGTSLEVHLIKSPRGELLQRHQKEFEDLTGIKVGAEQMPEQQSRQKTVIEFNSGRTSFDVVHLSYHVQKRQFAKSK